MQVAPINLKNKKPFAVGGTRYCYVHPEQPDRCIKVLRSYRTPEIRRALMKGGKRFLPLRNFDDQWKEQQAYESLLPTATADIWAHVPEYFGTVPTDIGLGIVTKLFRNHDGSYPETLEQQVPNGIPDALKKAIEEFKTWLREHLFLTRGLLPHNIIVVEQTPSVNSLVIVDGIGNSEMIPISSWFTAFAKRKIERKIRYFDYRINELLG